MGDLYVATGDSFVRLTRHGDIWRAHFALEGSGAHTLIVDRRHDDAIYCASLSEGVWKTTDGGVRWANLSSNIGSSRIASLAFGHADGALFAGGVPGALWVSHDEGKNWEELENLKLLESASLWNDPLAFKPASLNVIAPNPQHADWLLAAIDGVGIVLSTDGGWSWDDAREEVGRTIRALKWHHHTPAHALAIDENGVALSIDGGWSWQRADDGLHDWQPRAILCDPNPDHRANWLLVANDARGSAALLSGDGIAPWQSRVIELPPSSPAVGVAPRALCECDGELFIGVENGAIICSRDGQSWTDLAIQTQLGSLRALGVANLSG